MVTLGLGGTYIFRRPIENRIAVLVKLVHLRPVHPVEFSFLEARAFFHVPPEFVTVVPKLSAGRRRALMGRRPMADIVEMTLARHPGAELSVARPTLEGHLAGTRMAMGWVAKG